MGKFQNGYTNHTKLFVTSGFRNMITLNYNDRRAKQLLELEIGQEVRNAPL